MASYQDLVWHRAAPGVWQRVIDEIEEFYATMMVLYEASGRMFFGVTGHVSLGVDVLDHVSREEAEERVDAALSKAWLALRYDHPTIAAQVSQDRETKVWTKTYRKIQDDADLEAWLKRTIITLSTGQTGVEWANSDPPAPSNLTCFVLRLPASTDNTGKLIIRRDLVLRSPHDIIDGIGTLVLLRNLITHASEAYAKGDEYRVPVLDGSEADNLSPPYRIAANIPSRLTKAQEERVGDIVSQKATVASSPDVEILALPFRRGALVPGRHQRSALTLSRDETSRLLVACKAGNATPTHVFHAAAAMVVRDLQPRPSQTKRVRYINYILRNERSHCVPPFNSVKHPAALYHSVSGNSLVVDMTLMKTGDKTNEQAREDEFLSIVKTIKDFYEGVRNDSEHYALAPNLWMLSTPPLPSSPRPLAIPPPKLYPSVSISSMGLVDTIIAPKTGAFKAYNPWATGEELGNGLGMFLGTFEGELCLSAAYNDAWHTEADVADYLWRCKDIVFKGFGIR